VPFAPPTGLLKHIARGMKSVLHLRIQPVSKTNGAVANDDQRDM